MWVLLFFEFPQWLSARLLDQISSNHPCPFAKIKEMHCHELRFNSAL